MMEVRTFRTRASHDDQTAILSPFDRPAPRHAKPCRRQNPRPEGRKGFTVSKKVDFTHSMTILGALEIFPAKAGLKLGLTPSNPDEIDIFFAEYPKCLSPKVLNVVHRRLLTISSRYTPSQKIFGHQPVVIEI